METAKLKKFAQFARRSLVEQVSAKLKLVLAEESAARRESFRAIKTLEEVIKKQGKEQVIERVAYIWFNRFCALRFMDVNRYTRIGVVSPAEGQFQPEILAEAKMGHIDEELVSDKVRQQIFTLLDGNAPSRDPQGEAYRLLVVAVCNFWNKAMPFLFQRIDDYTELLMPDDLLTGNSIIAYTREAMTPDACKDVEVIGWLYQFYISEKKDEVFEGLKKNKKITPENIPAATQLFTPHWIVRYLVENSLGRLWMLNHPNSKLVEQMDYYIKPEQAETDFLRIAKPEEIKICDPACGSGHMLTYAFDLLYAIYEEEGYEPTDIPQKILHFNLYGIEIDERAGELAAFALTMKARAKQRRFFNKGVKPNICVLENIYFDEGELKDYIDFVGGDLFTVPLQTTLQQFEEADNLGSLIRPELADISWARKALNDKNVSGQLFLNRTHSKVLHVLQQADYLSSKYHVIIANPPYMGGKGMNGKLNRWLKSNFPSSNADLFSAFMERILLCLPRGGFAGMMTPFTWMFLSSFTELRNLLILEFELRSLIRPEYHSFFESAYVPICAFTVFANNGSGRCGTFIDLQEFYGAIIQPQKALEAINNQNCKWRYTASSKDFRRIPGSPIAYWVSDAFRHAFEKFPAFRDVAAPRAGLATGDNSKFQRAWSEISLLNIAFDCNSIEESRNRPEVWYPCNSGGMFRKWFGNNEIVVNWKNDGYEIRNFRDAHGKLRSRPQNTNYYFCPGVTWTKLSSSNFAARLREPGFIFDDTGRSAFPESEENIPILLAHMCSSAVNMALKILNPSMSVTSGDIGNLPFIAETGKSVRSIVKRLVQLSKFDWDFYESSWNFTNLPLLHPDFRQPTMKATCQKLCDHWRNMTLEMQRLEEENNRIFIEAYGLQDELTAEVPLNEITLTCNQHYRYGNTKSEDELEALLLADTMRELVSYAVGCMFGRYALDRPGLILANQGETINDYLKLVPEPSFPADDDNVIPMLNGDWFTDDIAERFRKFLRVTFGDEHYEENLQFVENSLNVKGKRKYTIRDYFLGEFYSDHVKRYKKRPIYWLFSSPKGSFNALIYMHRYRPDTVGVVLNDYLREFRTKLSSHQSHIEAVSIDSAATKGERTNAIKDIEKTKKIIDELNAWEHDVLFPLASQRIEIDLDDGVKANYPKFGDALKKVPGLSIKS